MIDADRRRRIWVIDPSLERPEPQGMAEILEGWSGERRIFRPALVEGEGLTAESGYETDGVVLMGSGASVYDDAGWLRELKDWLAPLLDGRRRLPLLGICFGHQLIAHLAGARIDFLRPDRGKLVGVGQSRIERSTLLGEPRDLRVVVSHREQVVSSPPGYRVIARREGVPVDGIEHERLPVHSFQFHPEAREEFAEHAGIPVTSIDSGVRRDGRALLGAFRRQVLQARSPRD